MAAQTWVQHDLLLFSFHINCFQQGECALWDQRYLSNDTTLWPLTSCGPGPLSVICGVCYIGLKSREEGRSVCCHQFLHFKQTSGHRLHLQTFISSSDQTGAHMRPLETSPQNEYHTRFPLFAIKYQLLQSITTAATFHWRAKREKSKTSS